MRRYRPQLNSVVLVSVTLVALLGLILARSSGRLVSAFPLGQDSPTSSCRKLDRSLIEFNVDVSTGGPSEVGRVLSANDGTLAVIVISSEVNEQGAVLAVDFAASVRVNAIIIQAGEQFDNRAFDPPVRSGTGVRGPDNGAIDSISFCYRVSIPSPPRAASSSPEADQTVVPASSPTPTQLTLDIGGIRTAEAKSAEIASTATAAAIDSSEQLATAQSESSAIAATATAAAETAIKSDSELAATIAAQDARIASVEADASNARSTADALRATIAAPTQTPTETPTIEPTVTSTPTQVANTLVYETTGVTPFADWQPVNGWDLSSEVARTDGSGERGWLVVPVPTGLSVDAIVEVDFRIVGGEVCPRNFGFGMRGSATGFYATGIEWACDPGLVLWAASNVIGTDVDPALPEPGADWHTMTLSAVGDQITVSLDGVAYISVQNGAFPAGNLIAFWTDAVGLEIRKVRVWEVSS